MSGAIRVSSQGKGAGGGNRCGRRQFWAVSQHVSSGFFFEGATHSLEGAKQHADKRSEKVTWLWTRSVCKSKVLCSNSVRRLFLGFAGVVWVTFGIGQALEVSQGGSEEHRAGDFSRVQ